MKRFIYLLSITAIVFAGAAIGIIGCEGPAGPAGAAGAGSAAAAGAAEAGAGHGDDRDRVDRDREAGRGTALDVPANVFVYHSLGPIPV